MSELVKKVSGYREESSFMVAFRASLPPLKHFYKVDLPPSASISTYTLTSQLVSNVEKQFILQEHDAMFGSFNHFKEISIIFGYAVMFSVAFPLAPALAWVAIYLEIRVDAWVLLQKSRRPTPTG